jgi:hypothetical protein
MPNNKITINPNLESNSAFDQISFSATLIKDSGSGGDIYHFIQTLDPLTKQNKNLGNLKEKYEDLLLELRLSVINMLSDTEIEEILKSKMFACYTKHTDLQKGISLIFVPSFIPEDFTKLNSLIRDLEENVESVGTKNITLKDGKTVAPTISNWLKDYKSKTNTNDAGNLNIASYFTNNKNTSGLDQNLLNFLAYILYFYDWLRFKASKTSFEETEPTFSFKEPTTPLPINSASVNPQRRVQSGLNSQPSVLKPRSTVPAPGEKTEFEKRLAQINVQPSVPTTPKINLGQQRGEVQIFNEHGGNLEELRKTIQAQKKPIPPVNLPTPSVNPVVKMTPDEIKREIKTTELPPPEVPKPQIPKPVQTVHKLVETAKLEIKWEEASLNSIHPPMLSSLNEIRSMEDLKKIEVANLRQGSLYEQTLKIKTKIKEIAGANMMLPYYAVGAFEQSPLFRAYVHAGTAMIHGEGKSELSQKEFEAIADLKRAIESFS